MLQFITHPSDKYSIAEEVQMAIEGGCRWIQLRMKNASDEEVRETALQLVDMCREHDAFLVIDDRVNVVNDLKVSGVHLGKDDMGPLEARELLGPNAVIGVTANTAADIIKYKGKDIDYVGLGPFRYTTTKEKLSPVIGLDGYAKIVKEVRDAGVEIPIVAVGGITLSDVEPLMKTGVNGIAVSGDIINAPDPMLRTSKIMEKLLGIPYDKE
ncbi:MAG: thiamine phosphate synthase [Firmicutes bacterium]|nr:thiamine phosphate synthase [Bacillota bacterium]MCM1401391.1 thiamine phosphate synthase [Bacteroides sp.]MCM1477339.1 thiamine phosphate synthase [Bacteroides sp.]